jgi:hypothetical protein
MSLAWNEEAKNQKNSMGSISFLKLLLKNDLNKSEGHIGVFVII